MSLSLDGTCHPTIRRSRGAYTQILVNPEEGSTGIHIFILLRKTQTCQEKS